MCQATLIHEHESGCDCGMENTWPRIGQVSNQLVLAILHLFETKLGGLRKRCKQFGGLIGEKERKEKKERKKRRKRKEEMVALKQVGSSPTWDILYLGAIQWPWSLTLTWGLVLHGMGL